MKSGREGSDIRRGGKREGHVHGPPIEAQLRMGYLVEKTSSSFVCLAPAWWGWKDALHLLCHLSLFFGFTYIPFSHLGIMTFFLRVPP